MKKINNNCGIITTLIIYSCAVNALRCEFTDFGSCDLALGANCSTIENECILGKVTLYFYAAWYEYAIKSSGFNVAKYCYAIRF